MIQCHFLGTVCFHNFTPFFFVLPKLLLSSRKSGWNRVGTCITFLLVVFFKKEILRRTLCTNKGRNDARLHVGLRPVSLQTLCRNCCLAEPASPGAARGIRLCRTGAIALSFTPSAAHPAPSAVLAPASPQLFPAPQSEPSLPCRQCSQEFHLRGLCHP